MIKSVTLPEAYSKQMSMILLHGEIKWSHEGFRYFLIKILIFTLVKEILFHTGKSPLVASEILNTSLTS